jgi:hypothetical protein
MLSSNIKKKKINKSNIFASPNRYEAFAQDESIENVLTDVNSPLSKIKLLNLLLLLIKGVNNFSVLCRSY